MAEITTENVEKVFRSTTLDEGQVATVKHLEDFFVGAATEVLQYVPRCADRSAALRKLLEVKMTCIQAVAKGGLI